MNRLPRRRFLRGGAGLSVFRHERSLKADFVERATVAR